VAKVFCPRCGNSGRLPGGLICLNCGGAALLGHLRSPGPHVKGCWAVDQLLGHPHFREDGDRVD
jgi:hypothetical protein